MTKSESRPLPGDSPFELFGPSMVVGRRRLHSRVPSLPVPDLDLSGPNGSTELPRFHTLSEHEFDVVAVVSAEGRLKFVSASAERMFGYDVNDAIGLDVFELFDPESIGQVRLLFRELVAGRRLSLSFEMRTLRADGRAIDLDVVAANHLEDPIGGIVVNVRDITERKRLEQRIREVDKRQAIIIDSLADGVVMVDATGVIARVNEAFEVMFEAPRVQVVGKRLEDLTIAAEAYGVEVVDADGDRVDARDHPVLASLRFGRRSVGVVLGIRRRAGAPRMWIQVNVQPITDADGAVTGAVASIVDVTATRQAASELREEERFLQVLLDTLDEGILACDADGRITVFNPAARRLHGLAEGAELIGTIPSNEGMRRPDGKPIDPDENPLAQAMSGQRLRDMEILLESDSGEQRKVSVNGQPLVDEEGWMLGAVVAMHDVTEQKMNEERLAELALRDPLTGLANRTLLAERLQQAIDGLARQSQALPAAAPEEERAGVAVFLLDLDEFKEINDELGHDVGDDMLIAVARRLSAIVRPSDTVARLGGDEFVVVCDIESGEGEMLRIADRISTALARPYRIDGRTLSAVASVGGVYVDNPDTDPSKLLSRADDAMYGVKWSRRRQRRSMMD